MIDPQWLTPAMLIPVVGLLMGIKSDLASLKAVQAEHERRLGAIDAHHARTA